MFGSTFAIQTLAATTTVLSTESKSVSAGEQFTVSFMGSTQNLEFSYLCARFKDLTFYEDHRGPIFRQQHKDLREAEAEIP